MRGRMLLVVVAVVAVAAVGSAQEECLYVAAAGRSLDSPVGHWETELDLANLGARPLHVRVELLTRGAGNVETVSRQLPEPLAPGASQRLEDVVGWVLERQWRPWYGGLAVCADGAGLQAVAQVMFAGAEDGFGAAVNALPTSAAISRGRVGHVLGLREDAVYRSNLDLLNLSDVPVSVTIRVVQPDGARAYFVVQELPARGQVQLYRMLARAPEAPLESARLELTSTGPVLAVASRVDRSTNDPTILPATVVAVP